MIVRCLPSYNKEGVSVHPEVGGCILEFLNDANGITARSAPPHLLVCPALLNC